MTRTTMTALAALALATAPATAAVTWDTNDDGSVNAEEFVSGYSEGEAFNRFDDDDDNRLTPEEVGLEEPDAVFEAADANDDGVLSQAEVGGWTFGEYDVDADEELSEEEMAEYEADEEAMRTPLDDLSEPGPKYSQ
jgi:opacity protein-like surface antigen